MNLVQITPGAGGMYCGNCFRDNALVGELRRQGHHVVMVPLYLPMTLDEADQSAGTPVFFGGISVYLEQEFRWFRAAPRWLRQLLASPALLKLASGRAAKTRAADLGELTLSMLRGESGNQVRELEELLAWLKTQPKPDAVCLSNALLLGMARRIRSELGTRVICMLQGEDGFLDALPQPHRDHCWQELSTRAREVDGLIAPSRYFGDLMAGRMGLPTDRVSVVYNGIGLAGYGSGGAPRAGSGGGAPVVGFFARMCPEKGLDLLVEAFLLARRSVPALRLKVGGSCGPGDEAFVARCRGRLQQAGAAEAAEFHPNLDREAKIRFLESLTLFSVPATYSEAFGLYLLEALAAGVPVVQPRRCAFPELVERTGGGIVCEPTVEALARGIVDLASDPDRAARLGRTGRGVVAREFSVEEMGRRMAATVAAIGPNGQ